jgi:pimeloyl-ACP methyl ester carboxylesterase
LGINRFEAGERIDDPALSYNRQEWFYFLIQPGFIVAAASELENRDASTEQLRRSGTLGDKPLIVLIARDSLLDLPLPAQDKSDLNKSWVESEKRLTSLSSRGKWVIVPGAGHMIPFDQPEAIVSAVREISAEARQR